MQTWQSTWTQHVRLMSRGGQLGYGLCWVPYRTTGDVTYLKYIVKVVLIYQGFVTPF